MPMIIEILGYMALYLIVAVLLLPYHMVVDRYGPEGSDTETPKGMLHFVALIWPITIIITIFALWLGGWKHYSDYK